MYAVQMPTDETFSHKKKSVLLKGERQRVEKDQRSWKQEDGERNSVKDAFELEKLPL